MASEVGVCFIPADPLDICSGGKAGGVYVDGRLSGVVAVWVRLRPGTLVAVAPSVGRVTISRE